MEHKTLICINTCNRLFYLKWFLPDYLALCNQSTSFDLVVALDGNDSSYIDFCNANQIPLIYSEERLGVGISKNRAFKTYPNYQHYFFLDDDAELVDPLIFSTIIELANKTSIPHFSQGGGFGFKPITGKINEDNFEIIQSKYGSGQFSYFNGNALRKVGGWHTLFAKYKRGGHTEHSYRFFHDDLSPAPFHHIPKINKEYMNWHQPDHVTQLSNVETSINSRLLDEEDLIEEKLKHFPVKTLSKYNTNKISAQIKLQSFDYKLELSQDRILKIIANPFFNPREKRQAIEYYLNVKQEKIDMLNTKIVSLRTELNLIKASGSYKLAKSISKAFNFLRIKKNK